MAPEPSEVATRTNHQPDAARALVEALGTFLSDKMTKSPRASQPGSSTFATRDNVCRGPKTSNPLRSTDAASLLSRSRLPGSQGRVQVGFCKAVGRPVSLAVLLAPELGAICGCANLDAPRAGRLDARSRRGHRLR